MGVSRTSEDAWDFSYEITRSLTTSTNPAIAGRHSDLIVGGGARPAGYTRSTSAIDQADEQADTPSVVCAKPVWYSGGRATRVVSQMPG